MTVSSDQFVPSRGTRLGRHVATLGCSVRARVRGSAESRAALPGLSRRRGLASTDNRWPRPESSEGPRHRQSRLARPGSHYTMEVSSPSLITHNSLTSARLEAGSRGPQLLQFYIASDNFCNIRARGCNILGPGSAGICVAAWAPLWPQCCSGAACAQVDTGLCPSDGLRWALLWLSRGLLFVTSGAQLRAA